MAQSGEDMSAAAFSSFSWITSPGCSYEATSLREWLRFVFLSPCPLRALSSAVDILFLLTIFFVALHRLRLRLHRGNPPTSDLCQSLIKEDKPAVRSSLLFKLSLTLTAALSFSSAVLFIFSVLGYTWRRSAEPLFLVSKAIANLGAVFLIVHEKRFEAATHARSLRLYWVASFLVTSLLAASAILRFVHHGFHGSQLLLDDVFSLATFPISLFLLCISVTGSTGVSVVLHLESEPTDDEVTPFPTASLVSQATWRWMNPLLKKGYRSPLKLQDIPTLAEEDRAQRMFELFRSNWPSPALRSSNPVLTALLRCFWPILTLTASLSLIRLSVLYIGPLLINRFVEFVSGKNRCSPYEGLYLCGILMAAKTVEVFASHQCNFQSLKLGMLIRSTLITSLYRKGLRLSCSSRQSHGVGKS